MPVLRQPQAYAANAAKLFGEDGMFTNVDGRNSSPGVIERFAARIDTIR